jgi:hypothetical protein
VKTITDEISKKQIYAITFMTKGALWFLVFCIIMPLTWYYTRSALFGIAVGVAIPAFWVKRSADKKIRLANELLDNTYRKTMSALENVDYYHYHSNGALAVDARNGLIAYIKTLPNMEILPPVFIRADDIVEYSFYDPGVTTTTYYGNNLLAAQQTLTVNIQAMAARSEQRGLHIKTNDLQNPRIIMNMLMKDADYWILIVKKLIDRTLETNESPKMIP